MEAEERFQRGEMSIDSPWRNSEKPSATQTRRCEEESFRQAQAPQRKIHSPLRPPIMNTESTHYVDIPSPPRVCLLTCLENVAPAQALLSFSSSSAPTLMTIAPVQITGTVYLKCHATLRTHTPGWIFTLWLLQRDVKRSSQHSEIEIRCMRVQHSSS